jgi:hypothetical protein
MPRERASKRARAALGLSILSLIVAGLTAVFALPQAVQSTSDVFGIELPHVTKERHRTSEMFFELVNSFDVQEIRASMAYASPGSSAEEYAELKYKAFLGFSLTPDPEVPAAPPKPTWKGSTLQVCTDGRFPKDCADITRPEYDENGLLSDFLDDGFPLRSLLVLPGAESDAQDAAQLRTSFVGAYPSLTTRDLTVVLRARSLEGTHHVELSSFASLGSTSFRDAQPRSAGGAPQLEQGQSSFYYVSGVPDDTQWMFFRASDESKQKSEFWVDLTI